MQTRTPNLSVIDANLTGMLYARSLAVQQFHRHNYMDWHQQVFPLMETASYSNSEQVGTEQDYAGRHASPVACYILLPDHISDL